MASWPKDEAAVKAPGARSNAVIHPGLEPSFNNDTTALHDEQSAAHAWGRTLALFNRKVRA